MNKRLPFPALAQGYAKPHCLATKKQKADITPLLSVKACNGHNYYRHHLAMVYRLNATGHLPQAAIQN